MEDMEAEAQVLQSAEPPPKGAEFFDDGGEVGALIRARDWSTTPLGHPAGWPQPLKTAVSIMLNSGYPIYIAWGDNFVQIYNDAYRPILGAKHPAALGSPTPDTFPEIWDYIGPMFRSVMSSGQTSTFVDQLLPLSRNGFIEECYFVFSYSPIRGEHGEVGGVFVTALETTERVLRDRRQRTLRELSAISAHGGSAAILAAAGEILAKNADDFRFVCSGSDPQAPPDVYSAVCDPQEVRQALAEHGEIWSDAEVRTRQLAKPISCGPQAEPVTQAVRIPITVPSSKTPAASLVVGLSPRLAWDAAYEELCRAVASTLAVLINEAEAFELERRRAEALAEIDAAKTIFFSNVSHEFRTPLTLMLSPIEELLSRPDLVQEEGRALLELADRNALRLLRLVNTLLDFSRIEAGRMTANYEAVDLSVLTADVASSFRSVIENAGLEFVVDCPPFDRMAIIDRDMWEKIVLNLISNAFKFTFTGQISVRVRYAENAFRLFVQDTGTGIPESELPRLFERFHRVEGARGRSNEGTGIGLALVRELVKLHNGELLVRSSLGEGSTFIVTIPEALKTQGLNRVSERESKEARTPLMRGFVEEAQHWNSSVTDNSEAQQRVTQEKAAPNRKVLVVDDNSDLRDYIARLLEAQGYEVVRASDGESALKAASHSVPDLVLADIMMPGLSGIELLQALRSDAGTARVPVILLSARAGEEARLEGLSAGADDYIVKPFSARELIAKVAGLTRLEEARREAAKIAEEESRRTRKLFEQAPGFITILSGPNHVFEFANTSYYELVGNRSLIGKPVREALPEIEGQAYFDLLDRVYATGERYVGREAVVRLQPTPDAAPRTAILDFIYEPTRDSEGRVTGIFVEGYEVTERVSAQAALRKSEEQLRLATEAAEIGLWDVDNINDALYWPARVKAMFGISPNAPATMDDYYACLHPDDREATVAAYLAANDPQQRAVYDVEYRTIGKEDGAIRWVAAKGRGIFDDLGRCVRVIGTAIDITDRKAKEAQLKELNESLERRVAEALAEKSLLAEIVEGTDAFVQVAALDFTWLAINRASANEFERIFGVRPKIGDNMLELLAHWPEHQASVRAVWSRALSGEEFTEIGEFGDPGRDRRFYEMKFNVLRDREGNRIGAYQFVYDVTERLRDQRRLAEAEATLRQTQKLEAMGQLTGGVAHDFNNLLTPIIAGLDMLQRGGLKPEREQRLISGALQSAERAKTLVQRLLAFSRRQPLQPRAVDVGALVSGMAELVRSTSGPQIKVLVEIEQDLPPAQADANQLEMAILNLSVNARDAMAGGGTLRISADLQSVDDRTGQIARGRYVRLSVADNGCGMEEQVMARAVEPFFSTKGVGKGTGLGLSMVHGLASQLGGALKISSRVGLGTNVELWLPVSKEAAPEASVPDRVDFAPLPAGTVLLVDDDEPVRMTTVEMLNELGFRVVEAGSAERALSILEKNSRVDFVITDHLMPGITGTELAYAIRERWPSIKTLIISGYAQTAGIAPDLPRLTKPFRQAELNRKLLEIQGTVTEVK